jgi:hypothetical protein
MKFGTPDVLDLVASQDAVPGVDEVSDGQGMVPSALVRALGPLRCRSLQLLVRSTMRV